MPNIDDLSISVKSNVTSATNSIDKLITKLGALSASLGQVNTSGFSAMASGIRQITSATKSDSVKSITELANSIKKFGHQGTNKAVSNIPYVAQSIQLLANTVNGVNTDAVSGITNIAKSISRLGYATADKAITNIPQINTQLQGLIGTVNSLSSSSNGISYLSQLSSALTKLGGKTGTTAVNNIPNLTKALNQMIATLSKAPQVSYNTIQLVNSLANLASQGSKVGTASNSLYNGFMRFGAGADHARKKSFSLASAIGKLYASYWLFLRAFGGIKKSIDIASDLQEVENVVNKTFGVYRGMLDSFTDKSLTDFGLTELDAKNIASRYQAMGTAMGFPQEQMANMSIELTKLSGDLASFYNESSADTAKALQSVFTGETEPLRRFGLSLDQVTIKEWALSQGMDANISSMTQAEKTMLRYQYVMANTMNVQGDFKDTMDSWHNSLVILTGSMQELMAIGGNIAINFLKPLVSALSQAVTAVISFAQTVQDALGTIFGWKYEYTGGALDTITEDAYDLGGGLGSATDKAKKLKQQLQGFDELNVLSSNSGNAGGGGGAGGGLDTTGTQNGKWELIETEKVYESDLDSLYKLGDYIGTTLTNQLRSIDWQNVYQGAKDFGIGLADFLNGLISPDLFSATGATIAGALNTAIYSTLAFGETFDFEEFGLSIAEGINTFFRDTDFSALADDIDIWVDGIWQTILTAVKEIEWNDIFSAIYDFFTSLDADTVVKLVGLKMLAGLFSTGFFASIKSKFTAQALFSSITSGMSGTTAPAILPEGLKTKLGTLATTIFSNFNVLLAAAFGGWTLGNWLYENTDIGEFVDAGVKLILPDTEPISDYEAVQEQGIRKYGVENGKTYAEAWQEGINQGMASHEAHAYANEQLFSSDYMQQANTPEVNAMRENVLGAYGISLDKSTDSTVSLAAGTAKLGKNLIKTGKSIDALNKSSHNYTIELDKVTEGTDLVTTSQALFGATMTGVYDSITNGASGMSSSVVSEYTNMATTSGYRMNSMRTNVLGNMVAMNNSVVTNTATMATNAISKFTNMFNEGTSKTTNLKNNTASLIGAMTGNVSAKLGAMNVDSNKKFSLFNTDAKNNFTSAKNNAVSQIGNMSTFVANKLSAMNTDSNKKFATFNSYATSNFAFAKTSAETQVGAMATSISGKLGAVNADSDSKLTSLVALVANRTSAMATDSNSNFGKFQGGADTGLANMQSVVGSRMIGITKIITGQSWYSPGANLVAGLAKGIADKWSSTSGTGLVGKIVSLASGLTAALKRAFGIHSPSRLWEQQIGQQLTAGLRVGVLDGENDLIKSTIGMGNRLTNSFSGALTLATPSSLSNGYDFGVTSTMSHNFSADTSMTSNIADGVRQGLSSSQAEQNALLREQNELLMRILDKTGISSSDLFNAVRRESRQHYNQTGTSAFVY